MPKILFTINSAFELLPKSAKTKLRFEKIAEVLNLLMYIAFSERSAAITYNKKDIANIINVDLKTLNKYLLFLNKSNIIFDKVVYQRTGLLTKKEEDHIKTNTFFAVMFYKPEIEVVLPSDLLKRFNEIEKEKDRRYEMRMKKVSERKPSKSDKVDIIKNNNMLSKTIIETFKEPSKKTNDDLFEVFVKKILRLNDFEYNKENPSEYLETSEAVYNYAVMLDSGGDPWSEGSVIKQFLELKKGASTCINPQNQNQ